MSDEHRNSTWQKRIAGKGDKLGELEKGGGIGKKRGNKKEGGGTCTILFTTNTSFVYFLSLYTGNIHNRTPLVNLKLGTEREC